MKEKKEMKFTKIGLIFQLIFVLTITIFNPVRVYVMNHYSVYPVALCELFIGLISLICGVMGLIKKETTGLSNFVLIFGLLICFYFVFLYLLGEAGNPPAIPWFYSN